MRYQLHVIYGDRMVWFEKEAPGAKKLLRRGGGARELTMFRDKVMPEAREALGIPASEPPFSKRFDLRIVLGGPEWQTQGAVNAEL